MGNISYVEDCLRSWANRRVLESRSPITE